jgi:tRNA-2-methylthio-N6-dimethylallyladenosine synthase
MPRSRIWRFHRHHRRIPWETEDDSSTLGVVRHAHFDQSFNFIYSPREGTPAATMGPTVGRDVIQDRFDRLVALVQRSALEKNRSLVGSDQEVLFEGASKRDPQVLAGRSPGNKVVHVALPMDTFAEQFAGRILPVRIKEAQTWFLAGTLGTNL